MRQQSVHIRLAQGRQPQQPAARTDGRQQPAGTVADQQQQRVCRRFLQYLQDRVGGVAVHLIDTVDHHHAPALAGCRLVQETGDAPSILDDDLAAFLLGAFVDAAFHAQQIGMAGRRDLPEHGAGGIDFKIARGQIVGRRRITEQGRTVVRFAADTAIQGEAGDAVGETRLADPGRAGDQPGMRQFPALTGGQEGRLRRLLSHQQRVGAGLRPGLIFRAHDLSSPKRVATASRIAVATVSISAVASITTQRSGSCRAISRKPSRSRR